jgi:hypothetical protein
MFADNEFTVVLSLGPNQVLFYPSNDFVVWVVSCDNFLDNGSFRKPLTGQWLMCSKRKLATFRVSWE